MNELTFPTTAGQIGKLLGAEILGDETVTVERVASLTAASAGDLSFLSESRYQNLLSSVRGAVVLTKGELANRDLPITYLVVAEPKRAFAKIAKYFVPSVPWRGVAASAVIDPTADLAESVSVGPGALIGAGAKIGRHSVIYPGAYVGPGVEIGEACEVHPNVVLLVNVRVGNRVRIFAGTVIGSEGFGFLEGDVGYSEMPQLGMVVIEDDVRIGAKCTIDRGTLGETRIGQGSKLDDQVHVGHNVLIGKNCILCGQVGLSGSCKLEDGVILAGQVGVAGHLTVGRGAIVGGQTGIGTDLEGGKTYFMTPAVEMSHAMRIIRQQRKLPELAARIRKIEERINDK